MTSRFFDPTIRSNPYPRYHELRANAPVHWDEGIPGGAWILTRYADVAPALRDPRLSGDRMPIFRLVLRDTDEARAFDDSMARWLLNLDPPRHTPLRALVARAFTPRIIEALRPRVQAITDKLLHDVAARGHFDVIADLAYPLPVTVIAELLGVPAEDRPKLREWSVDIARFFGNMRGIKRAMASDAEFRAYLSSLCEKRRAQPTDDLLSALLAAEDAGNRLSEADVVSTAILLFIAGHETTTHLIGNGLLALLQHPAELALVRERPELMPGCVEELLRYDSTVQFLARSAKESLEIGGVPIERGQNMMLVIGAANRDPAQFPDPDRLDVRRAENRHVSFGLGFHYCLGAPLARMEGAIALQSILSRWPRLRLANDEVRWQDNFGFRGLESLPLLLD